MIVWKEKTTTFPKSSKILVTGELLVKIPEQILNDMDWYEGTEIEWTLDGDSAVINRT